MQFTAVFFFSFFKKNKVNKTCLHKYVLLNYMKAFKADLDISGYTALIFIKKDFPLKYYLMLKLLFFKQIKDIFLPQTSIDLQPTKKRTAIHKFRMAVFRIL